MTEGFSGDISADNALQVSVIRNGLVVHIYTNLMQQSIFNFGIQHLWRDIILMKFISVATVPPTSYVLQLGTLAGGTTDYYASHIQTCFNVIVSSYAEYHKLDPIQTKSTIIHHLKNTLTNRVAVNHCVVQSLRSSLDIELLELKCNVHPLDGIAKRCTDLLKVYDKEYNITSDTFGNGCCAVNFMYAMTKMHFK